MKQNKKFIGIVGIIALLLIFLICMYVSGGIDELNNNSIDDIFVEEESSEVNTKSSNEKQELLNEENKIVVEIKGEVKNPNIYYLEEDSIIDDLIVAAGGLRENANTSQINRAEQLQNHQSIYIPSNEEIQNSAEEVINEVNNRNDSNLININSASVSELDALPGVGPSKAQAIVTYREENGPFKSIEEIKNVSGIGESSFEKIKDLITT